MIALLASLAFAAEDLQLVHTRTGQPRFVGAGVHAEGSWAVFLERFATEPDPRVRVALLDAMRRSGTDAWSTGVVALQAGEADEDVRRMIAEVMASATADAAAIALPRAMADGSARVRAAAMRAVAGRDDADAFADLVRAGLADADARVRSEAAFTAGVRRIDPAGADGPR